MTPKPILYVGIAAPLAESARLWLARLPEEKALPERRKLLGEFPAASIGAYGLSFPDAPEYTAIAFRTGFSVSEDRVRAGVEGWCGTPPDLLPQTVFEPVSELDHRRALMDLQRQLDGKGIRIIPRVGLTLGQLQRDLAELAPELVLIDCHGTKEGCLILEDGRGQAHYVPGDQLFAALDPQPAVLILAACHSERVLDRAKDAADWRDAAIVHVLGDTPIEVPACVAFQSMFYLALLRGETAGAAFDAAQQCLANDPTLGQLSVAVGEVAPSDKFKINDAGRQVRLKVTERPGGDAESGSVGTRPAPPQSTLRRRARERFVGRRREMAEILDELLPLPPGVHRAAGGGQRRLITLTKEGGIGKTAIATEITDWVDERNAFPGGMLPLACEWFKSPDELLSALLTSLGVDPKEQQGDLLELLRGRLSQVMTNARGTLLVLDNLDQLIARAEQEDRPQRPKHAQRTRAILETMLDAAPDLRVLATCRWPLGMPEYELPLGVGPMAEDEAKDVFAAHLESPHHRVQVRETWDALDSPIRQIVNLSGRHPQSLQLLARQMTRPGMTLEKLRDEARENLLGVLTDPLASDNEQDRLRKVEMSYELSYRHLGKEGKQLFERLSRLPGGVWCGQLADRIIRWENLLGPTWRQTMEKELDYFALVHFEPDRDLEGHGTFEILNPMREFARSKYRAADHAAWEKDWLEFWAQRLGSDDAAMSGRIPEGMDLPDDKRAAGGEESRQLAKLVAARTQANWTAAFEHAAEADAPTARSMLLRIVTFCELSAQRVQLRNMAEQAVAAQRKAGSEKDLASCLGTLGNVLHSLGDFAGARDAHDEAAGVFRSLVAGDLQEYEPAVAKALNGLGIALCDLGDHEAARDAFNEALGILRRLAKGDPAAFDHDVAMTLNNLGNLHAELGEHQAARGAYIEALEIRRRQAKAHPAAFEQDVATLLNNLGDELRNLGEHEAARDALNEALEIRRRQAKAHPAAFDQYVATTLNNLGMTYAELGEREAARNAYNEALAIYAPLVNKWPAAFGRDFLKTLRNYTNVTPEDHDDRWWQLWNELRESVGSGEGSGPADEGDSQET